LNIFLAPGRFGHYTGLYWAYYAPYNILTNTSHNIFWMKKTKVYADLGQQKMVLGPILMHITRASPPTLSSACHAAKIFLTSKF
jgi:hypothetical protein